MKSSNFALVLGGGAARGMAHIGVIRRLEELEKTPSIITGTSIGAVIGAFYACGYTSSEMEKIATEVNILTLIDFDLTHGIVKGKKIIQFFEKYFGETTFAETKIKLIIIATDIDTGEKIVCTEGKIIDAIRASISIPGVFAPYKHDGRKLVDGGLTENLPIEVLPKEIDVIAVSVQMPLRKKTIKKSTFFFPNGTVFSNSYQILRKTIGIMIAQNEIRSLASRENIILIQPKREDIDFYDFKNIQPMIEAGYREAGIITENIV